MSETKDNVVVGGPLMGVAPLTVGEGVSPLAVGITTTSPDIGNTYIQPLVGDWPTPQPYPPTIIYPSVWPAQPCPINRPEEPAPEPQPTYREGQCHLLTTAELARVLGLSKSKVYAMLAKRELPYVVLNSGKKATRRVLYDDLVAWVKSHRVGVKE